MRILIISCVFPPEPVVSSQISVQIAEKMTWLGHHVRVLAPFPSRPARQMYPMYKRELFEKEDSPQGYEIIRIFSLFSSISSLSSRFLENISFGLSAFLILLFSPPADIVYGNTWPIFAQSLLLLICKLRRMPLVLSIQDLYPESLIVQDRRIKNSTMLYKFLRWLDIQIAENCKALIVISEQFKQAYIQDRGIKKEKIQVIPNWIDPEKISGNNTYHQIRQRHNIPKDAFLVVFGGNVGVAAGVDVVIHAFRHLSDKKNIYLLIAGDGSMLRECQELVEERNLLQIKFHNPWLTGETFSVLQAADLLILPTQGEQAWVSVPSKLLTYLFSGRSVLAIAPFESEVGRIIKTSGAGWVIFPNDTNELASTIVQISELPPHERNKYGKSGQVFASKYFSKKANLPKVVNILELKGKGNE